MPTVKDLELNKFKRDSNNNIEYTANRNSKVVVENASHDIDSFGRLRISQSFDIFDNKNVSDKNSDQFNEVTVGAGAIAYNYQKSEVSLSISQANNDRSLRESRYLFYIPGKGQNIVATGVLSESNDETISVVTRSSTSGSPVDTKVEQSDWLDKLDGTGRSGQTIDFTKAGIFKIDFQWLGVGKVKFSIVGLDGGAILIHEDKNSFANDNVYMRSATLPIRYEIVSDGSYIYKRIGYFNDEDGLFFESKAVANTGTYTLKEICCSVATDGGVKPIALEYHANTRGASSTATTSGVNVLAVKLADAYKTKDNRKTANLIGTIFFADDKNTIFEVYKVTSWTDTGSSWTAVNTDSACEYAAGSNISLTISTEHMIACDVVAANSQGSKASSGSVGTQSPFELLDENRIVKQNYDSTQSELFLIKAYTMADTTTVGGAMTWLETE